MGCVEVLALPRASIHGSLRGAAGARPSPPCGMCPMYMPTVCLITLHPHLHPTPDNSPPCPDPCPCPMPHGLAPHMHALQVCCADGRGDISGGLTGGV